MEIQHKHQIPKQLFYSYLHFKHFFLSKSQSLSLDKPSTFELLCAKGPYQTHLISSIYKYLLDTLLLTDSHHLYIQKWSQITQRPILLPQWQNIWESISNHLGAWSRERRLIRKCSSGIEPLKLFIDMILRFPGCAGDAMVMKAHTSISFENVPLSNHSGPLFNPFYRTILK